MRHQSADLEDQLDRAFPGRALFHVLEMLAAEDMPILLEALKLTADQGAKLQSARLTRVGASLNLRVTLTALSARDARRLADRIRSLEGVSSATVEHHLGLTTPSAPTR